MLRLTHLCMQGWTASRLRRCAPLRRLLLPVCTQTAAACQRQLRPALCTLQLVVSMHERLIACTALQVVAALKQLASEGHTVVCSIHQPRSSIFAMFDDLILLSEGACLYSGACSSSLSDPGAGACALCMQPALEAAGKRRAGHAVH